MTMLDFFDYSGVMVQADRGQADLIQPESLGYKLLPQKKLKEHYEQLPFAKHLDKPSPFG